MDMCIKDPRIRYFNWFFFICAIIICCSYNDMALTYFFKTVSIPIIAILSFFSYKKKIKISPRVVIFAILISLCSLNCFWEKGPVSFHIFSAVCCIPFNIWIFIGISDGICILFSNIRLKKTQHLFLCLFLIFVYTILLLRIFWQGFLPYGRSPDVINQWNQIHGIIPYSDVHAIGHTIFLKIILSIYDSYSLVIWVHIIFTALLYCAFSAFLLRNGIPFIVILIGLTVFNSGFAPLLPIVFPWKDLPYSLCLGVVTLLLMKDSLATIGKNSIIKGMLYGVSLSGAYLLRLNGIVVLVFVGLYKIFEYIKGKRLKELTAMIMASIILIFSINYYGYNILGATHAENGFSVAVFGSGIAAAVNDKNITEEELNEINEIIPVDWMQEHYTIPKIRCLIWDNDETNDIPEMEVYNNRFVVAMGKNPEAVIRLYIKLLPRHFVKYIKNIVFSTAAVWGRSTLGVRTLFDNSTLLILTGFLVSILYNRKMLRNLIVLSPMACNVISIAISSITNEDRYLFPTVMLFSFIICYIIISSKEMNSGKNSKTTNERIILE